MINHDLPWFTMIWTIIYQPLFQWDFQDPQMEVRKRTICLAIWIVGDIPWNLGLKNTVGLFSMVGISNS
jgi:flagellar biosynthesis regulator FlaF